MAEGLFEKIYSASKEVLDGLKKPLVKSALKRKFRSAYDAAETKKIEINNQIDSLRETTIKSGDKENNAINDILQAKKNLELYSKMQEMIKEEYQEIFAEPMKVVED